MNKIHILLHFIFAFFTNSILGVSYPPAVVLTLNKEQFPVSFIGLIASTCLHYRCTLLMTHLSQENELNCPSCLGLMMGTTQISFCVFLGCVIAVQSVLYHNGRFTQDVVAVYENRVPFSFGRNFDFTPQGTIFSSWRSWSPDFRRLAGLSPFLDVPRVQVYCDASTLTVLVDKSVSGLKLTGEEIQLGNGCFSNGELANEFVFTYGFDECGTTPMVSIKFCCSSASFYEAFTKTAPSYRWRMTWRCSPTPCS